MTAPVEAFAVVLAAVAVAGERRGDLAPVACASAPAGDSSDDRDVFKLAARLIPVLQEQLKEPAVLKEIKSVRGTFAMTVTQDGKPAGSWCVPHPPSRAPCAWMHQERGGTDSLSHTHTHTQTTYIHTQRETEAPAKTHRVWCSRQWATR
jgi:hypothetical protein